MPFRILVTARSFANTSGPYHDYLRNNDCEVDLRAPSHPMTSSQLAPMLLGYDGVILGLDQCDAAAIAAADRLKVISRYGVGVDAVDLAAAAARGIAVTNTPGANMLGVSELTLGLIFALARQIPQVSAAAKAGEWKRPMGWELSGKTLGVVGFGAIGRDVATKALALGMTVIAYDPFWSQSVFDVEQVTLAALFARADVVTLHSALTPETTNLINETTIQSMKDGAYLINTARGELVDEEALYAALQTGKLGGAAMDAFHVEPPVGSPLLTLDTFLAIPHLGATTRESTQRVAMLAAQNLVQVLRGEACPYVVNAAQLRSSPAG
jgi:D-3-phosphoglycerate dehydrogenase